MCAPCMHAGVLLYHLPLGSGQSKSDNFHHWGFPHHSLWCCYGTAVESYAKLADSIYFRWVGEVADHATMGGWGAACAARCARHTLK